MARGAGRALDVGCGSTVACSSITHYTRASLAELAARYGLTIVERAYVLRSELIVAMRKAEAGKRKT